MSEASGALGDLGTLLPLMLGAVVLGGMAPTPVLLGFAVFYIGTAFAYRLPIPVQPMKAVGAVLLLGQASPESVARAGVLVGAILLGLGLTGWIDHLKRLVPQSVLSGLQLGLGLALAIVALDLMSETPGFSLICAAGLAALFAVRRVPVALVFLAGAAALAYLLGVPGMTLPDLSASWIAPPGWPDKADLATALGTLVLPQLALTLTNAVLLTALVASDCHGTDCADRVSPRRLSITTGLANLFLTPLGALPMCHGAGGVAAHWRFGARTAAAPLMLGLGLAIIALLPGGWGMALIATIPVAALGALLMVAAADLAFSKRLFDCRPSCRPVIAVTAAVTVLVGPFAGLVAGTLAEIARKAILRRRFA